MPTKLQQVIAHNAASPFAQARRAAQALADQAGQVYQTMSFRGPWQGYAPDLDGNLAPPTSAQVIENLVARRLPDGRGEVLATPPGFGRVDPTRLPLGDDSPPAATGRPIVHITQVNKLDPAGAGAGAPDGVDYTITPMAATAGDGATSGSGDFYRIPGGGIWTHVGYDTESYAAAALTAGRDGRPVPAGGYKYTSSMPDSCVAPFGAPARTFDNGGGVLAQNVTEPALIYTNDVDGVMIYPFSSADPATYGHLAGNGSGLASGAASQWFKAKSVETFNGRVYFLNTEELGTRYPQRVRRSARGTADPLTSAIGAGFIDFTMFQTEGVRIESLGDVAAVYFQDGVAFLAPTGIATMPDVPQVVTQARGLLGTHAMCSVGRNKHFGIFTDGWWFLDSSGRWDQVNIVNLDGTSVHKWRNTFFGRLDAANQHRLTCFYHEPENQVYITMPTVGTSSGDVEEVWVYDIQSDRVFIRKHPATCFGYFFITAEAATTWADLAGTTWEELAGTTWADFSAEFGPRSLVHGNLGGLVFYHSNGLTTYDGGAIPWLWQTHLRSLAGARNYTTVDRLVVEYYDTRGGTVSMTVFGGPSDGTQNQAVSMALPTNQVGDLRTAQGWFRFSAPAVGFTLSGSGPTILRAVDLGLWVEPNETRGM